MVKNFEQKLTSVLKKDLRFLDEDTNELLRNEIVSEALKVDKKLIELLIGDPEVKKKFFIKIKDCLVFNVNDFILFIQDKNFLIDSYTKFKNKIGLNVDGKFLNERKEVSLVWPFKDCVLEGGMTKEDQKRNEIFFNEILAKDEIDRLLDPKVLTNFKKYTAKGGESIKDFNRDNDGTIKDNLIIKGNNLLALHTLKKEFQGKVKLIYIDPPYNTKNDSFTYNDKFNRSTWLTFMKNRLEVAKYLLNNKGVIFVQIDEKQNAYLKILMDEIFNKENFITTITCKVKGPSGVAAGSQFIFDTNEYIHVYTKTNIPLNKGYKVDKEIIDKCSNTVKNYYYLLENISLEGKRKIKELSVGTGVIKIFKLSSDSYSIKTIPTKERNMELYSREFNKIYRLQTMSGGTEKRVLKEIPDNEMYVYEYTPTKGKYRGKIVQNLVYKQGAVSFLRDVAYLKKDSKKTPIRTEYVTNSWMEGWWQGIAKEGDVLLKNGKKPEQLIHRIIDMSTEKGDLVLDYHLGSGTTCAVAHKMERQYIGIEQLDYKDNDSLVRINNVINGDLTGISKLINWTGGGEFIFFELMKHNENAVDGIQKAKTTKDLLEVWSEMCEKYFLNYDANIKKFNDSKKDFEKLALEKQKSLLIEMLNKNQLYVNLSEIDDAQFKISNENKELNKKFYGKK